MRLPQAFICLMAIISTDIAFAGEVKKIEVGDFQVEYQISGPVKTLADAKKACLDLGDKGAWRLPGAVDFLATLMTGNSLFTTVPTESGSAHLAWIAGDDVPTLPPGESDDSVVVMEDGRGTSSEFMSISETLKNFTESKISTAPAEKQIGLRKIKTTLEVGVQVVCMKPMVSK